MTANTFKCDCNTVNEDIVKKVISAMPSEETFSKLADFYKIIGNDTRCKIIYSLSMSEMCVCDLSNVLSMTKSSVSHQLSKMRETGVVKCRRCGKEVYYSLDDEHVASVFAITLTHINHKYREDII